MYIGAAIGENLVGGTTEVVSIDGVTTSTVAMDGLSSTSLEAVSSKVEYLHIDLQRSYSVHRVIVELTSGNLNSYNSTVSRLIMMYQNLF